MGTKGKRGKHRVGTHRKEVSSGDEVSSSEESVDQDEVEGKKPLRGRKFGMSKHRKKSESSMSLDDM
jgi:hypothetical protein